MKKIDFNQNWTCRCLTREEAAYSVTLPHDAMISEPRSIRSRGEGNIGWYIGGDYEYSKKFVVEKEDKGKEILIEFEGVYHNAEVYINQKKAAFCPYGYTNFYVDTKGLLKYGVENEIRVIAHNSEQPNSRWYTGTGIYRPVYLWTGKEKYIRLNGVKIRTVSYEPAVIEVEVETSCAGKVRIEIWSTDSAVDSDSVGCTDFLSTDLAGSAERAGNTNVVESLTDVESADSIRRTEADLIVETQSRRVMQSCAKALVRIPVPDAKLWSCETPHLYTLRATFGEDVAEEAFGIRCLEWNAEEGMCINGKRVLLRGACIHHDNGILGACAFPEAEERKVRILKENGYNALRSAHNPCSKALLSACDRLGMLMVDEYADMWYIHKTEYDYANNLISWWRKDLKALVEKDYNHPCVIMYSTGNEVSETAQKRGIKLTRVFTRYLHRLDGTRPVTCGINIFFNFLSSIGLGVYSDDKARKNAAAAAEYAEVFSQKAGKRKKKSPVGSEFYNTLAAVAGDYFMKCGATLYPCDLKTKDAFANMDIAGYNYGIFRYRHDLKKYPERLILGSETFCKDACLFWEIAKKNKRIIGDFVWTGIDYIGETGEGAPEYRDYKEVNPSCRMTGGYGRMDLTGKPRAEAAFTRVAFNQEPGPYIAVSPVEQNENLRLTGWALTKAIESWSFRGCSGRRAVVEVYARAAAVDLYINGKKIGRKTIKKNQCRVIFKTIYEDGEITAVSYNKIGKEIGRQTLKTAGEETMLIAEPEEKYIKSGGLAFVRLRYTDKSGIWKPMEKHRLKVKVKNGILAGLGSANPYVKGNYTNDVVKTYFGEALAAVRADGTGPVQVMVSDQERRQVIEIPLQSVPKHEIQNS